MPLAAVRRKSCGTMFVKPMAGRMEYRAALGRFSGGMQARQSAWLTAFGLI